MWHSGGDLGLVGRLRAILRLHRLGLYVVHKVWRKLKNMKSHRTTGLCPRANMPAKKMITGKCTYLLSLEREAREVTTIDLFELNPGAV